MMTKKVIIAGWVVLVMVLSGCGAGAEETATPEVKLDSSPVVSVTGEVVPATWASVSAQVGGTALEVLVEPGDEVAAGDPLVRLDPTDAQHSVQQAEAALETAQAELALLKAGPRAEDVAVARAQVEAAEAEHARAAARRDQAKSGVTEIEIAAAEAQVTVAQADQLLARETHGQTMECYNFTLPDGTKEKICPLLGPAEEQARFSSQAADGALEAARARLDALRAGAADKARAADAVVDAAAAQRDIAQAQLDLLEAGATAEEIAASEAAVAQAQAVLDAARAALERAEVRAPLAGTVGMVDARAGELVVPGQPLVTLGDLTTLRVETTDLDETDVARVAVGQKVDVTFDALSKRVFAGHVTRIAPMADPGAGGVNYTVVVVLDEIAPVIRWGMTAFVDIHVAR
jgi:multidrug efflux pump subunit AcrA (membrane-fusion protein)